MIIECINCNKKFEVNSELIPNEGRNIQCGSCNYVWFFNKNQQEVLTKSVIDKEANKVPTQININPKKEISKSQKEVDRILIKSQDYLNEQKSSTTIKFEEELNFTFSKLLSYTLVSMISFIGLIIILDTFKTPLYDYFPNLEFILFNLFELIIDIKLFIKDLI